MARTCACAKYSVELRVQTDERSVSKPCIDDINLQGNLIMYSLCKVFTFKSRFTREADNRIESNNQHSEISSI